jgi:hypothetical protein
MATPTTGEGWIHLLISDSSAALLNQDSVDARTCCMTCCAVYAVLLVLCALCCRLVRLMDTFIANSDAVLRMNGLDPWLFGPEFAW